MAHRGLIRNTRRFGEEDAGNNNIRRAVHARLWERGWADRINQVSFRLLRDPSVQVLPEESSLEELSRTHSAGQPQDLAWNTDLSTQPPEGDELLSEDGEPIVDVTTSEITGENGAPRLGGLRWSDWHPLDVAAPEATTDPGVYIARSGSEVVYVGMAGERRGLGVRGRLQIYARGRGAVSGLGEAALDRALADPAWLSDRLHRLHADAHREPSNGLPTPWSTPTCISAGHPLRPRRQPGRLRPRCCWS